MRMLSVELFCYFFNNDKDCPYQEECIFLHEESEVCKFGKTCDRVMCMFRHDFDNGIDERNEQPEEAIGNNNDANEYVVTTLQSITNL